MVKKQRMPKRNQSDKYSRNSGRILLGSMILVLVVLGVRFSYVAVAKEVKGHKLDKAAQLIYQSQNEVQAKRGEIFDSVGNVLAENSSTYTAAAVLDKTQNDADGKPAYVKPSQDKKVAKQLAGVLGGKPAEYQKVLANARKQDLNQVQFGQHGLKMDVTTYKKVKALKIPGIIFTPGTSRFYPNGKFASDLVGMTSEKVNDKTGKQTLTGMMGLEQAYNKQLTGKNGVKTTSVDDGDLAVSKHNQPAENGYDIYTTLNTKLQTTLEKKMDALDDDMKPKSAIAVVMDTKTGNIVATTQRPTFNATTRKGVGTYWNNELASTTFEPGSVMKGITLAAAIDTDNWNGDATYQSGTLKIGDRAYTLSILP